MYSTCKIHLHQSWTHGCIMRAGIFQEENTHLIWHFSCWIWGSQLPWLYSIFSSHWTFTPTHQIVTAFFTMKHKQMGSCVTICNPIEKICFCFPWHPFHSSLNSILSFFFLNSVFLFLSKELEFASSVFATFSCNF